MLKEFPGEKLLIKVIDDLADFLPYLVLVGDWVPYIYARHMWKDVPNMAVTTGDIDFGVGDHDFKGKDTVASRVQRLGYGERHASMDRMIPFVPIVKDASGDAKAEVEFITDPKVSRKVINKIVGQEIKINEIQHFSLLLGSVMPVKMNGKSIQIPTESMFVFHIQKLKEGKQVKENLKEYFSSVDSKGPLFVEQENGPDAYVANVREDAFEKFGDIRRRVEK